MTVIEYLRGRKRLCAAVAAAFVAIASAVAMIAPDASVASAKKPTGALGNYLSRSPGTRGETFLVSQKVISSSVASERGRPGQRALGKIFDTPPDLDIAGLMPAALPDPIDPGLFVPIGNIGALATDDPLGAGAPLANASGPAVPIGGGAFIPTDPVGNGNGGSGGGTPGGGNGGAPIPSNPAGVPEPGTWVMLLLGMAMTGAALRHNRAATNRCNQTPNLRMPR